MLEMPWRDAFFVLAVPIGLVLGAIVGSHIVLNTMMIQLEAYPRPENVPGKGDGGPFLVIGVPIWLVCVGLASAWFARAATHALRPIESSTTGMRDSFMVFGALIVGTIGGSLIGGAMWYVTYLVASFCARDRFGCLQDWAIMIVCLLGVPMMIAPTVVLGETLPEKVRSLLLKKALPEP